MQHPVGYRFNPQTGRAEMNDFAAVLFNKVQLVTFPHVVLSAYMTGAAFVVGIAFWHLRKASRASKAQDVKLYTRAVRTGAAVLLVAGLGVAASGDVQGKIMTEVQPMKMAAAEGLYDTETSADFSLLTRVSSRGSAPAAPTAPSQASTSFGSSTRTRTARTPVRSTTPRATTHRSFR